MLLAIGLVLSVGALEDALAPQLSNPFQARFTIDSTFNTDVRYEVSASEDAGPYGRAYLSYVFTDK